ncbi:putative fibronectin type III, tetratricopeptide-like helical domain superfamily, LysM [Plasmopara halstedii]
MRASAERESLSVTDDGTKGHARKLQQRAANRRLIGSNLLCTSMQALSLPRLLSAKHEAHEIQMDLIDAQSYHNRTVNYCGRQFAMEDSVGQLRRGIRNSQLQIRQKTEELEELERRVSRLSRMLCESSNEKKFSNTQLEICDNIRMQQLDVKPCRRCGRHYLSSILKEHERNCVEISLFEAQTMTGASLTAGSVELQNGKSRVFPMIEAASPQLPTLTKFVPQAPRNVRISRTEIMHNAVTIRWDLPIFTGLHTIFDYELSYSIVHTKTIQNVAQKCIDPQPPLRLSQWCLTSPLPIKRFFLTCLSANQEYGEFALRSITVAGMSESSNKVDIIRTMPAVSPTIPLFFCVERVTTTSITLNWMEPFDDGGEPIQNYEVVYLEAVLKKKEGECSNIGHASKTDYIIRSIRTNSTRPTLTLTNLLSGVNHLNFQVRAINTSGLQSNLCDPIKSIFTKGRPLDSDVDLFDELKAAIFTHSHTIDSHILSGFTQRYEKFYYVKQLSKLILSMHPEMKSEVHGILSQFPSHMCTTDMNESASKFQPTMQASGEKYSGDRSDCQNVSERRRQFDFRISALRSDINKAEYNIQWCKDRQIELVGLIRAAETSIYDKQVELERARMFKGPQMDSDVFETGLQRFFTKDLIAALEDEIEIDQLYILDTKTEIVQVGNYLRSDIYRRETLLRKLVDRQEALQKFEICPETTMKADKTTAIMAKIRSSTLSRAFASIVANRFEAIDKRKKVCVAFHDLIRYRLHCAVQRWKEVTKLLACTNADADHVYGIGGIGLRNAALGRNDIVFNAHKLLFQLRFAEGSLQDLRWTTEQKIASGTEKFSLPDQDQSQDMKQEYHGILTEGDASMIIQNYERAFFLYRSTLNNDCWMQKMSRAQQIEVQIKLGEAAFCLNKHDRALTIFNCAAIMANREGLLYKEGLTLLRVADTQYVLHLLDMSIESYERALPLFKTLGDPQGQLSCYRGLQHIYEQLGNSELINLNKCHADEIESVLSNKLSSAGQKIEELTQRLIGPGAEGSCLVTLERVSATVPQLRRQRTQRKLDVFKEKTFVSNLVELLSNKKLLLVKGEEELTQALESDSSWVDSTILIGSVARYELDDFRKKLAKLSGCIQAGQERIDKEVNNAKIRIRNAEEEIEELEVELAVETGALMRKCLPDEKIRCFSFNATNEGLGNVIGTASHGISTCFACAGASGLLYDILSGACLEQAVGDLHEKHLGDPIGHQAPILCVYYIGSRVYTGSADASLGVWEIKNETIGYSCLLTRRLTNFDAAVTSVVADAQWIACGLSDCSVFVLDVESFAIITHIIAAHDRTVTALSIQSATSALTTGGADKKIKVWQLDICSSSTTRRKVRPLACLEAERRSDGSLNGHIVPITCVRRIANEIVSGDTSGFIAIWNLDADNKLLRMCEIYQNLAVTCLQFDATRIVCGAGNGYICVVDFATGCILQTMRGHQDSVLDLQFDRTRLISMSADAKLRLWYWQTRDSIKAGRRKYHILGAGETLRSLSLLYRTSVQRLLHWNSISDSTKIYLGQKLIVEVEANTSTSELNSLDRSCSVQYGKVAYENIDYISITQKKRTDVKSQWAAQRLSEYFPPLDDGDSHDLNLEAAQATTTKE